MAANSVFVSQSPTSVYYHFTIKIDASSFTVSILADNKVQFIECSCGNQQSNCIHIEKIISGDKKIMTSNDLIAQNKLINALNATTEGRNFLSKFNLSKEIKPNFFDKLKTLLWNIPLASKIKNLLISDE